MRHRKGPPAPSRSSLPRGKTETAPVSSAFDLWLERGLHKLFDDVASEPIPPELLQLIEEDRLRTAAPDDAGETAHRRVADHDK